ncbi:MAG TPA: hypothetical protein VK175_09705 [Leadbetterella sp.]|nr:hypothetical protein [Leadbetterella sp.]
MKKLILISLFIFSLNASACDVCGCGNGSSFFGILPQSHFNFGGLRYQTKTFDSHFTSNLLRTEENFQSIEPWLRLYPLKKTQLILMGSLQSNTQTIMASGERKTLSGIGDVSALAHYNLVNTFFDSTAHSIDHIWLLGGGIKLPTGKFNYAISQDEVANPNFQLGTGSVDYIINSIYTVRKNNIGLNFDLSYKINGTNKNNYKFANKSRAIVNGFMQLTAGDFTFLPNLGVLGEYNGPDKQNGIDNQFSGGYLTTAMLGSEVYYKKITAGFSLQKPIAQDLSGSQLKLRNSFMCHLTLLF